MYGGKICIDLGKIDILVGGDVGLVDCNCVIVVFVEDGDDVVGEVKEGLV